MKFYFGETFISYERYLELCVKLVEKLKSRNVQFDLVLGVMRNGMFVAQYISNQLDIPVGVVDPDTCEVLVPRRYLEIIPARHSILVVDEILDTGETMKRVVNGEFDKYYTAVLIKKSDDPLFDNVMYVEKVEPRIWVKFFYESDQDRVSQCRRFL